MDLKKGSALNFLVRFLTALSCLLPFDAPALPQNTMRGPIPITDMYPWHALRLSFVPERALVIGSGQLESRVGLSWANSFVLRDAYTVDAETRRADLGFRYGLDSGNEVRIGVPVVWRGGGALDATIDRWHRWFSLPGGERTSYPDNEYLLYGLREDGGNIDLNEHGTSLGNVSLGAKRTFSDNFSAVATASLPTARTSYGHEGVDLNLGLLAERTFGQYLTSAGLGYLYRTDVDISGVPYARQGFSSFISIDYLVSDAISGIITGQIGSQVVDRIVDHPNYFVYLDIGGRVRLNEATALEIAFRENPAPGNGTADVTFVLGITKLW